MNYSRAVRVGDSIEVSGTTAVGSDGQVLHPGDPVAQAAACFATIRGALEELGSCLEDIVRTRVFVTDVSTWKQVGAAHDAILGQVAPASSLVGVAALLHPDVVIEIEATAIAGSASANSARANGAGA